MKNIRWKLAALGAAIVLAACGGSGGAGNQTPPSYSSLVVFGDSLSDVGNPNVGTIAYLSANTGGGGTWTVNNTGATGNLIWTSRLAALLGLSAASCAEETGLYPNIPGLTGAPTMAHPGCTNYAQGSARVDNPLGPNSRALQAYGQYTLGLTAKPIKEQMAAHLAAVGGSYAGTELVTVMAGANDVFMELSLTAPANVQQAVANMALYGSTLGQLIKTEVLAKGAKRVLVLNVPDVAGTPFAKAESAQTQGLIDTMVQTFNTQLAAELTGVAGVIVGDTYSASKDQNANPAQYGLSNVADPACGPNALSNPATAPGTALICNGNNVITGDVSRYQYADNVHPTPYGHQLLSQFASKLLAQAGWL